MIVSKKSDHMRLLGVSNGLFDAERLIQHARLVNRQFKEEVEERCSNYIALSIFENPPAALGLPSPQTGLSTWSRILRYLRRLGTELILV